MSRSIHRVCCLFILTLCLFVPVTTYAHTSTSSLQQLRAVGNTDFPAVDPNYIYQQLFYMVTNFQHREAGYNSSITPDVRGHDQFADYWSQEAVRDLQGFGPHVRRDEFSIRGWRNRPAEVPAFNVEVSVPGMIHPEQVVVIGCHYDGEASSTQSANDDGSGCAIELGVAKALATYWRAHHAYPARTLRFVIFDAEEQGLWGSFHYLNSTVNGDVKNIVAMFNEEQNGIAYPLRYLGQLDNPLLPFYIDMSPLTNNGLYPNQSKLSLQQQANIAHFRALMQQAVPAVFAQFQTLGYQELTYHAANNQDIPQPIFTPDQLTNIHQEDDTLGGSDEIPFTLAGLPCATFIGNFTYYGDPSAPKKTPPPWSYPYDQPGDTIQLMNTFANGSSHQSQALSLALALPSMLTTWMLNQPTILGQTSADGNPIAAISDIGQTLTGTSIALDAKASFDPQNPATALSYAWNFGDGSTANGMQVDHTYTKEGNYTLTLTVSSPHGQRRVSKLITITAQSTSYANPYAKFQSTGFPHPNAAVTLPTPDDSLTDRVSTVAAAKTYITSRSASISANATDSTAGTPPFMAWIYIAILLLLLGVVLVVIRRRQQRQR
jgi:Peptidase family M28/PKD domain